MNISNVYWLWLLHLSENSIRIRGDGDLNSVIMTSPNIYFSSEILHYTSCGLLWHFAERKDFTSLDLSLFWSVFPVLGTKHRGGHLDF